MNNDFLDAFIYEHDAKEEAIVSKYKDKLGTPEDILKFLKETFPDKLPTREISVHSVGVLVGEQKVIHLLEGLLKSEGLI